MPSPTRLPAEARPHQAGVACPSHPEGAGEPHRPAVGEESRPEAGEEAEAEAGSPREGAEARSHSWR